MKKMALKHKKCNRIHIETLGVNERNNLEAKGKFNF